MATISVCISSPYSPVTLQTWCINSEHFGNFTADITNNTPVAINKAYIVTTCDRLKLIITNNIKVEINMPCASCISRKRSILSCRMWLNWNCLQAAKQIPILLKQGQYAMWVFFSTSKSKCAYIRMWKLISISWKRFRVNPRITALWFPRHSMRFFQCF